ncbi:MAG: hypothetical protein HPY58_04105 [Firmicutes bacterium]|nr:hypothetical protein [Bacillota bacterium]
MASTAIDERAFQVIQSFRPYLGPRGNGCVACLESLLELLASEPAQKTLDAFGFFGLEKEFKMLAAEKEASTNPFALFLILILLLLADLPGGGEAVAEAGEKPEQLPPLQEPGLSP